MINKVVRNRKTGTSIANVSMQLDEDSIFAGNNFLIVDDFPSMRNMLTGMLRGCGAESGRIDTAASASEALNKLANKRYDVVLCDYNLGPGKNGLQVFEEAKYKKYISVGCCWLIISAEKAATDILGMAELRPDAYLVKPVTQAILAVRLKKIKQKKLAFEAIDKALLNADYKKAIDLCTKRIGQDRENAVDLFRLKCELLLKTEQFILAKNLIAALLKQRELPWAQLMMAQIAQHEGDYSQAAYILENIMHKNKSYLAAYDELANVCCELNENSRAESILEKAISLSPKSMKRQQKMGEVAYGQKHFERAEKAFRESVILGEYSIFKKPNSYTGLARSLSAQGKMSEALNTVQPLQEIFPENKEIPMTAKALEGLIYHENNHGRKAEESARELAKLLKSGSISFSNDTLKDAAILLLNSSEKDLGVKLLQTEIMNHPEDTKTHDWVMNIFKDAGLGDQGLSLIETSRQKAIHIMDESVLMMDSGNFAKAVEGMREALQIMPKNARLLFNMSHVLITYMELKGFTASLVRETRRYLSTAHQSAPKEMRYYELYERLDNLLQTGNHKGIDGIDD